MDGEIPNVPHPEEYMMGIIRGEIPYVQEGEEDVGEGPEKVKKKTFRHF
jgi:hypothetical protein